MSGQIVRYLPWKQLITKRAMLSKQAIRNARIAGTAARVAFKYTKPMAANIIKRSFKRWKSARARTERVPKTTAQTIGDINTTGTNTILASTLNFYDIIMPQMSQAAATTYEQRTKPYILLRGIKLCYHVQNIRGYDIRLHIALLQAKDKTTTDRNFGFFRDTAAVTGRQLTFVDGTWDFRHDCFPINPDYWNILTHRKWTLGQTDGYRGFRNQIRMEKYFKINKKHTFTSPTDFLGDFPFVVAVWWHAVRPQSQVVTDTIQILQQKVVYYNS